ncbi:acyltransferase family protein [Paraburkholderia rhizosphaerae]|uniref:Peptidoglycan/LPS O-acetylase OafA/YrhL n=1 Tax=Paraburkholderia rhizosphaerae TaxID=480658 RepID=A0A4R8M0Q8_9BURK|nr:acyltransferase family protein [Paraburkholderia rhizosphaerae]TDY54889.1 peptidoglycan/LPS O-acetylase OafA/YrhL [Paraburkholderia rhizosphaerae]
MPASSRGARVTITPAVSVSLDLMRFVLAIIVVVAHMTQRFFQNEWPDITGIGMIAVGGFFVMSGYTIRAFSPSVAEFNGRRFVVDRVSRMLSVTLLALVATLALDTYSSLAAPGWYNHNWGTQADHPVIRIVANVLLLNQVWGVDMSPLSNSPFWSLGYEAGFYAIWGSLLFCRHTGRTLLIPLAVALLYGPNVIAVLPFWLAGVFIYDRFSTPPSRRRAIIAICVSVVGALVVALLYRQMHAALTHGLEAIFQLIGCPRRVQPSLMCGSLLFVFGLTALFAALELAGPRVHPGARFVAFSRNLGDATFPLYLLHFPVLVAIGAARDGRPLSTAGMVVALVALLVLAFAMLPLGNRLKNAMRALGKRGLAATPVRGVAGADDVMR